jgi:hypothetical protein
MTLTLFLSKALLCAATQCWPVLIGTTTPVGEFTLIQRLTDDPGYGGDVLQFYETESTVYAIHRTWTLRPKEQREKRLRDPNPRSRVITKGCVNVDPMVYNHLVENYRGATLKVDP